ncbi:MAG: type I methionyl aminopeptidase, partial [Candidatus Planktophila sp.]|nr:type I methionyl aminopeptidase [Candidatus Planktophila sp.]
MAIQIKNLAQLESMRKAGLLVRETLDLVKENIKPGITTSALDAIAEANIRRGGGKSNFKGYHGFSGTICTSINEEIVHGIPSDRMIMPGDVVSIDCGAIIEGWHGDAAFSVVVDPIDPADQEMLDVCEASMWHGIAAGKCGGKLTDMSFAIEQYIISQGKYGILREYGGHGIGSEMHQEPHILNFGKAGNGPEIIIGMALAIEPMITRGTDKTKVLSDDWTVVTTDKSRGAHFENSFAILPDGKPFVLTAYDGGKA